MKLYFFILILAFSSLAVNAQNSLEELLRTNNIDPISYISVEELHKIQFNEDVLIFDSREISEYKVSHIETAKYIGFKHFSKKEFELQVPNKNTSIVVYCSVGIRSEKIGKKLQKMGYTNVNNLYGGIFEWKNKDFPIVDSTNTKTEKIHAFSKQWSKWLNAGQKVYN